MMDTGSRAPHDTTPAITGILLTNLGSPDAPTPAALRRYLKEFLWDSRVVEQPRLLWWLILHGVILNVRPRRSAVAYAKIWTDKGSPLICTTMRQGEVLQQSLRQHFGDTVMVEVGMRYGNPSISAALNALREKGCDRLLVLPLYPQYSATTTATTLDAVFNVLESWRRLPELRTVNGYHDHPAYIGALASSVRNYWQAHGEPERLIVSFHGIPKRYFEAGDPYPCLCRKTARLLGEALRLDKERMLVTFQSRFGREEWVQPYTDVTLRTLAADGVASVDVICPGFAADCLETLEEIAMENRDIFIDAGGRRFRYIPALNASPEHIGALADIATEHLGGWLPAET
ncbi:MAG: ferrochelatase [Mariprofundaceae bacterium]|nr:ferrochelatase [Mariprofundaceae bacterium]